MGSGRRANWMVCVLLWAGLIGAGGGGAAAATESGLYAELEAAELDLAGARRCETLKLDTGFAELSLDQGFLVPARTASGAVAELVFVGRGTLRLDPEDPIEAGQLELFTGAKVLYETFDAAVFIKFMMQHDPDKRPDTWSDLKQYLKGAKKLPIFDKVQA